MYTLCPCRFEAHMLRDVRSYHIPQAASRRRYNLFGVWLLLDVYVTLVTTYRVEIIIILDLVCCSWAASLDRIVSSVWVSQQPSIEHCSGVMLYSGQLFTIEMVHRPTSNCSYSDTVEAPLKDVSSATTSKCTVTTQSCNVRNFLVQYVDPEYHQNFNFQDQNKKKKKMQTSATGGAPMQVRRWSGQNKWCSRHERHGGWGQYRDTLNQSQDNSKLQLI